MVVVLLPPQPWVGCYYEPGVDYAGDPAEDGQDYVDEQGAAAAFAQEHCEGREENGDYCFAAADLLIGLVVREGYARQIRKDVRPPSLRC